jgi:hypothetical protein
MIVANSLAELEDQLLEYYGQLNEIQAGLAVKLEDRVPKPEALIRYEMAESLRMPYVDGGLMDQPWIWVQEHAVVEQLLLQWKLVQSNIQQKPKAGASNAI